MFCHIEHGVVVYTVAITVFHFLVVILALGILGASSELHSRLLSQMTTSYYASLSSPGAIIKPSATITDWYMRLISLQSHIRLLCRHLNPGFTFDRFKGLEVITYLPRFREVPACCHNSRSLPRSQVGSRHAKCKIPAYQGCRMTYCAAQLRIY